MEGTGDQDETVAPGDTTGAFQRDLTLLLRARLPIVYIETFEEERVLREITRAATDPASIRTPRPLHVWTTTRGFTGPDGSVSTNTTDVRAALDWCERQSGPGVYVMLDLHAHLGDDHRPADPVLVRALRDVANAFRTAPNPRTLVIVSPVLRIPIELEKVVSVLDFPLPDETEIRRLLDDMIAANTNDNGRITVALDDLGRERITKAALGLTMLEATNAFARSMADDGVIDDDDIRIVMDEKRQAVRKSGLVDFVDTNLDLDDVGGLENLKRWLDRRRDSWLDRATAYGLPAPKGVLVTGVPGCGKSLIAKATAAAWSIPLLSLDIGRMFAGLVGSSEQNMRHAIRTAEAVAPCVLWVDEIEKGFSGIEGHGDSGTSSRVFGRFLTWMQEKTAPVFVIATANRVAVAPPEFLRKGRFDEIFFVDLPTAAERRSIWELHLAKRSGACGPEVRDPATIERLVEASEGYSGAEIEQAVIAAMFDAFSESRPVTEADLLRAVTTMVPLRITQAEEIASLREWARTRAVSSTGSGDRESDTGTTGEPSTAHAAEPHRNGDATRGGRTVDF